MLLRSSTPPLARRFGRATLRALLAVPIALWLLGVATPARGQSATVLVTEVDGVITPVIADHLRDGLARAREEGHEALVVELDTPGGLDASMREIIQGFLGADVPVVVHVAPSGARAASAGALITLSAHVAAMAPGTAIGAATPVDLEGGDVERKIIEDAAAYAESIARTRGRNTEFAVEAVREGRSITAQEARRIDVIDLIARNREVLLEAIDGRTVTLAGGAETTLRTGEAEVVRHELGGLRALLQWLADPNLAFLFMSIGTLAILYELANPGLGAAGIVGVIMILLALFGLAVLPVNALGGLLLALAAILFVVEIFSPGIGVAAAGGTASLLLGGLFLFRGRVSVDLEVLIPVALVVGGAAVFAGRLAWRTRRLAPAAGGDELVGRVATVAAASGRSGQVFVHGAWWNVRSQEALRKGTRVRVVAVEGLDLIVENEPAETGGEAKEQTARGKRRQRRERGES